VAAAANNVAGRVVDQPARHRDTGTRPATVTAAGRLRPLAGTTRIDVGGDHHRRRVRGSGESS